MLTDYEIVTSYAIGTAAKTHHSNSLVSSPATVLPFHLLGTQTSPSTVPTLVAMCANSATYLSLGSLTLDISSHSTSLKLPLRYSAASSKATTSAWVTTSISPRTRPKALQTQNIPMLSRLSPCLSAGSAMCLPHAQRSNRKRLQEAKAMSRTASGAPKRFHHRPSLLRALHRPVQQNSRQAQPQCHSPASTQRLLRPCVRLPRPPNPALIQHDDAMEMQTNIRIVL
jgi:hypothetical protein